MTEGTLHDMIASMPSISMAYTLQQSVTDTLQWSRHMMPSTKLQQSCCQISHHEHIQLAPKQCLLDPLGHCKHSQAHMQPEDIPTHLGSDVVAVLQVAVKQALGVGMQEVHGKVHALGLAAIYGQVPRLGGTCCQDYGV